MSSTQNAGGGHARRKGPTKGDLKEQAILDTAWKLIPTKPLDSITIDELAAGAGISRSTFYFYFDSKQAVISAVSEQFAMQLSDRMEPFRKPDGVLSIEDAAAGIVAFLEIWRTDGAFYRSLVPMNQDEAARKFWLDVERPLLDDLATAIEAARADGLIPPDPIPTADLVRMIFAMLWRIGVQIDMVDEAEYHRQVDLTIAMVARMVWGRSETG